MAIEKILISSAAFEIPRVKEHDSNKHGWVECLVISWNSKGQPWVVRMDVKEPKPMWIWPLGLVKDFEKTKGFEVRERSLRLEDKVRKGKEKEK